MTYDIKVIPGAKKNLWKEDGGMIKVYVTAPAVDNKANQAVIKFTAEHFGVRVSEVTIKKGFKNRQKTISVTASK